MQHKDDKDVIIIDDHVTHPLDDEIYREELAKFASEHDIHVHQGAWHEDDLIARLLKDD